MDLAGTVPAWVHALIEAAGLAGQPLDSIDALGRIYIQELVAGSIAHWMQGRWERAIFRPGSGEKVLSGGRDTARIAEQLLQEDGNESGVSLSPSLWEGLVAEEWAVETPMGPRVQLGMAEKDWLHLALNTAEAGSQRAQGGAVQAFLLRAERARQWRHAANVLGPVRENLLQLPKLGAPAAPPRGPSTTASPASGARTPSPTPTARPGRGGR